MKPLDLRLLPALLGICAGCGGEARGSSGVQPDPGGVPFDPEHRDPFAVNPRAPGTNANTPPGAAPSPAGPGEMAPASLEESEMVDSMLPPTPLGVLTEFCADCHAGRGADGEALGNIDYILDISRLAEEGWIVPLFSDGSPIVQMMRDGTMPPGSLEKPTAREINVVAQYIDNPNFWPEPAPVVETLDGGIAVSPGDAG